MQKKLLVLSAPAISLMPIVAISCDMFDINNPGIRGDINYSELSQGKKEKLDKAVGKLNKGIFDSNFNLSFIDEPKLKVKFEFTDKFKNIAKDEQNNNLYENYFYDLAVNDFNKKAIKIDEFYFLLKTISLKETLDKNKQFNDSNNKLNTKRIWEFQIFDTNNFWIRKKEATIEQDVNFELPTFDEVKSENLKTRKEIFVDWSNTPNWIEGEITNIRDGDTPDIKITKKSKEFKANIGDKNINSISGIRITGIDTPEKSVNGNTSTPFEYSFAEKSTEFAKLNLTINSKVRVLVSGISYDRLVGELFFGDKFQYSYSAEITRNGWTLPYGTTASISLLEQPHTLEHYSYYAIGEAMSEAVRTRAGFFKIFRPKDVAKYVYLQKPNNQYHFFFEYGNEPNNVFAHKDKCYPNGNKGSLDPKWNDPSIFQ